MARGTYETLLRNVRKQEKIASEAMRVRGQFYVSAKTRKDPLRVSVRDRYLVLKLMIGSHMSINFQIKKHIQKPFCGTCDNDTYERSEDNASMIGTSYHLSKLMGSGWISESRIRTDGSSLRGSESFIPSTGAPLASALSPVGVDGYSAPESRRGAAATALLLAPAAAIAAIAATADLPPPLLPLCLTLIGEGLAVAAAAPLGPSRDGFDV